jgi:putative transposase
VDSGCLDERLREYLFEIYDTAIHPSLGQSPRGAFAAGVETGGLRVQRIITYDDDFLVATLPSTPRGAAKVAPGRGVKINQIFYWSDRFRNPGVEGMRVPVRYDPFDAGVAYAFVERQWVRCCWEHHTVFKGKSQKEIYLASNELRRRRKVCAQGQAATSIIADWLEKDPQVTAAVIHQRTTN